MNTLLFNLIINITEEYFSLTVAAQVGDSSTETLKKQRNEKKTS